MNELDRVLIGYTQEVEVYDTYLRKPELPIEILDAIYQAKMKIVEEVEQILSSETKH